MLYQHRDYSNVVMSTSQGRTFKYIAPFENVDVLEDMNWRDYGKGIG